METFKSLKEKGICPTCFNMEHGGIYSDFSSRMLYENEVLYCFFEERPRSIGHTIILLKEHYNDMSYLPDDLCAKVYVFAKQMMNVLKESLGVERVYLCTMCDGEVNHFHLQLIPRHPGVSIGSKNFVSERMDYIEDEEILNKTRNKIKELLNK